MERKEIVTALQTIIFHNPDIVIGGSIGFIARGILHRDPGDIDLFVDRGSEVVKMIEIANLSQEIGSETTTDIYGERIARVSFKIGKVKVCVFKVPPYMLESEKCEWEGLQFNAQSLDYGIIAKTEYGKRNDKHLKDLETIFQIIDKDRMIPWKKSKWLSYDKLLHASAGFFVMSFFGLFPLLVVSVGKEILDEFDYQGFDWKDLIATLIGGMVWFLF